MSKKKNFESLLPRQVASAFSSFGMPGQIPASPNTEEKTFSLFQPDILLPAQYFATTKRKDDLQPEKKLMLAVLEDAIWCFQHCLLARDKKKQSLFSDAEEWIVEEHADGLFCFQNICEGLGLNPQYVREGLMRWKEKALTRRVQAQVYRLTPIGEGKRRRAHEPRTREHQFLKVAGC